LKISHEVSKAYRQLVRIINRLAVIGISSREKKSIYAEIPGIWSKLKQKIFKHVGCRRNK
jgi:hypothetical protein